MSRFSHGAFGKLPGMRRLSYPERAARQFIKGTRCSSPIEVVEKRIKTLDEWTELLSRERTLVLYVRRPKRIRGSSKPSDVERLEPWSASSDVHPFDMLNAT
jgi:hypothetical protein